VSATPDNKYLQQYIAYRSCIDLLYNTVHVDFLQDKFIFKQLGRVTLKIFIQAWKYHYQSVTFLKFWLA